VIVEAIVKQDQTMNSVLSGFSNGCRPVDFSPSLEPQTMFVFDRSARAVLVPLALLMAVVLFSNRTAGPAPQAQAQADASPQDHAVAANLPSR
jgi:hypothetical protein